MIQIKGDPTGAFVSHYYDYYALVSAKIAVDCKNQNIHQNQSIHHHLIRIQKHLDIIVVILLYIEMISLHRF